MSVTLNHNNRKADANPVRIEANEAIERSRFSKTSVQTSGDVYVSNKQFPSDDLASDDWAQVDTPAFGNVYSIPFPVLWVASTDEAHICSYVSGDL